VYTLYLYVKKKNEKTYLDTITWWREAHVTRPTRQVNPYGMCVSLRLCTRHFNFLIWVRSHGGTRRLRLTP
jgi:hypothetical protein